MMRFTVLQGWKMKKLSWGGVEDEGKERGNDVKTEVNVYLHQSKREEGCEGPARESRAHLAVGCWRPGEREWKPLRRKIWRTTRKGKGRARKL